jgi:enediyne biosynthesis protein E4
MRYFKNSLGCLLLVVLLQACRQQPNTPVLFEVLESTATGIDFSNNLTPTPSFNMFKYMYFYNGAGVGTGDFNKDGLPDLFFASNQGANKLYLNEGALHFKDITTAAGITNDGGWSTGVSVADINNDGLLDIYVCRVGNFQQLQSKNQLWLCTGITKDSIPQFKEAAAAYGIAFSGFSTQAAFLDYDLDGDLDMYLLNHSLRFNGTFEPRAAYANTYDSLAGDRFYRNDGTVFTDITRKAGINSSIIGYGLGIAVSDINLDGYPDIYIGNDFHENDYLYINQHNGTFKDELTSAVMHTSQFSMGVDVADADNDAQPEIISMDMLPADPYILKRSLGEDAFDIFSFKIRHGYNYQYARNNLQYNNGNGLFSEVGLYAGVYATDWSWAPLWVDFDNDGLKDLFISNGIPKRLNDIDYVNYASNDELQQKIRENQLQDKDLALIEKFPQIKLRNKFFINTGNLKFSDAASAIQNDKETYSNGTVAADFDNDGDIDIVVNNIDAAVLVYRNNTSSNDSKDFITLQLRGTVANTQALGAKVVAYTKAGIRSYEKWPVRGFQSSMEVPVHIGIKNTVLDSVLVIWPDNSYEKLQPAAGTVTNVAYKNNLPLFNYARLQKPYETTAAFSTNSSAAFNYLHIENDFVEFDREQLLPFMLSKEAPGVAVADINHDGLEDVFIGSSKTYKPAVFLQTSKGSFIKSLQPSLEADSMYEEVSACWADVNNDTHVDLIVASGGNEYYGKDEHMMPRLFLNNGKGNLTFKQGAFNDIYLTASIVATQDINGDGKTDLFIGARAVPWKYGELPHSYFLLNDGTGNFTDATAALCKEQEIHGFVKNAQWTDLDKDGDADLLLALEWDGIVAYMNNKGKFTRKPLAAESGWWNFATPFDIDNDGDLDIIAGNLGLNSRLQASKEQPVHLYVNDFDGNGTKEQILTYFLNDRELPFANKAELEKQLPVLKKKYLYAEEFAKASLKDMFGSDKLNASEKLTANYFASTIFVNDGKMNYTAVALPWQAQLSTLKDAVIINANGDALPDILIAGNFYENNIQMGRYDASYGNVLINKGNARFTCVPLKGLPVKGQVRHIQPIMAGGKQNWLLVRNNDSSLLIQQVR